MRWFAVGLGLLVAAALLAGCGAGGAPSPPLPPPTIGSYLADGFMVIGASTELVANMGIVVRDDRTVDGAGFFSGPVQNHDTFFSGSVDSAGVLHASGRLIRLGNEDVGAFTLTGTFGNFEDGSNVAGTFVAETIGAGNWRAFLYDIFPLGAYLGTYSGEAQGAIAIMNFLVDDNVVMIKVANQPQVDFFASDFGSATLSPPTQPGGDYGLTASDGLYATGFSLSGAVGPTQASGSWSQTADDTTLSGTWSASKPQTRAASRGLPPGPLRLHRVRK